MEKWFNFKKAVPVWESGKQEEMNKTLDFVTSIFSPAVLYLTGSTVYSVFLNGNFIFTGPARTAQGFFKVDRLVLDRYLTDGANQLVIRVSGYNVNSFAYTDTPSFLCAEVECTGEIVAATGSGFDCFAFTDRVQKVPRYSYQRAFSEVYIYNNVSKEEKAVCLSQVDVSGFIERDVPNGNYDVIKPESVIGKGKVIHTQPPQNPYYSREITAVGENYKGFKKEEFEFFTNYEYQKIGFGESSRCDFDVSDIYIDADTYIDLKMPRNMAGIIRFEFEMIGKGSLFISFDELLSDGQIKCNRLGAENVITIISEGCKSRFITAEPYVMQYIRFCAVGTDIRIKKPELIAVAFPKDLIIHDYHNPDKDVEQIYRAAVETFRDNAVDIYMDCPSRERAGWLCDSFFMGRTERLLTGQSEIERAFLMNYVRYKNKGDLPKGMIPMCYPSEVLFGEYIPNWAMWFIIHLYDYYTHTQDDGLINKARDMVYGIIKYFKRFENEFGLLEDLEGWVFVEWSKANSFTDGVNFPTNMVYAEIKRLAGILYDDQELSEEGLKLKSTIGNLSLSQSGFFSDNALRKDGKLVITNESSEVCQYYAFFFNIADKETHPELWNILLKHFPDPTLPEYKNIYPANAFIGNYLRMELLKRYGYKTELIRNIKDKFLYMAKTTGTLWEHLTETASCNHGFASYIAYLLAECDSADRFESR